MLSQILDVNSFIFTFVLEVFRVFTRVFTRVFKCAIFSSALFCFGKKIENNLGLLLILFFFYSFQAFTSFRHTSLGGKEMFYF